jgi:hypothetical protein
MGCGASDLSASPPPADADGQEDDITDLPGTDTGKGSSNNSERTSGTMPQIQSASTAAAMRASAASRKTTVVDSRRPSVSFQNAPKELFDSIDRELVLTVAAVLQSCSGSDFMSLVTFLETEIARLLEADTVRLFIARSGGFSVNLRDTLVPPATVATQTSATTATERAAALVVAAGQLQPNSSSKTRCQRYAISNSIVADAYTGKVVINCMDMGGHVNYDPEVSHGDDDDDDDDDDE